MVRQHPGGPGLDRIEHREGVLHALAPARGLPRREERREVEAQVKLVSAPVVGGYPLGVEQEDFAHHRAFIRVAVEEAAQVAQVGVGNGLVVERTVGDLRELRVRVGQRRILSDVVDHVGAKPVHPPVEPEAQRLLHGLLYLPVGPVEVGLLGQEAVEVELAARLVEGPGRPALREGRGPVVGKLACGARVAPHVPVPLGVGARGACLHEPGVVDRGVGGHPVDEHADSAGVSGLEQRIEVGQRAEDGIYVAVVRDVVAEVVHGRPEERREPERVGAQPRQVVEALGDAGEVAHAVAAAVAEGPWIDLVDHRALPPGRGRVVGNLAHGLRATRNAKRKQGRAARRRPTPSSCAAVSCRSFRPP